MAPFRSGSPLAPRAVFSLLLEREFPMNAFVLATEALRIANQNSGETHFEWRTLTASGGRVRASNGVYVGADGDFAAVRGSDAVLLFGGNLPTQDNSPALLAALRTARRAGSLIVAIDTGAFALADAGIDLDRPRTLHWEAAPAFRERHPDAVIHDRLYHLGERAGYCAGGVATLDLMLDLISRFRGKALADEVANALVHTPRPGDRPQRHDDVGHGSPTRTRRIIALMEQNLDFPLTVPALAAALGMSPRTLERRCREDLGLSPHALYLRIRLQAARNLLFYEDTSIKAVSDACGFSYPSVFARAFRKHFALSPQDFRASFRRQQNSALRPELRRL